MTTAAEQTRQFIQRMRDEAEEEVTDLTDKLADAQTRLAEWEMEMLRVFPPKDDGLTPPSFLDVTKRAP